jgi:type IV pilus assembly protein PilA
MTIKTKYPATQRCSFPLYGERRQSGFTLVELIVVCGILGLLATIAIPAFEAQVLSAKRARAVGDMRTIDKEIQAFYIEKNIMPDQLSDLGKGVYLDAWGRQYFYNKTPKLKSEAAVFLNDDYDLYSQGVDGGSTDGWGPLCEDDIVRASDGNFMGLRY